MSKKDDRLNRLIEILKMQNSATIRELAQRLDVSEMTVRRDLDTLKSRNVILDISGVAVLNTQYTASEETGGYQLFSAAQSHRREKERIGKFAASLIQQDDCIIIDNGTTVEYLADNIARDMKMTIFTCNLNILNKICSNPNISVMFGGGYYHPDTALFESPENVELIKKIRATKVFSSAAGVHDAMGVTCMNNYELEIKPVSYTHLDVYKRQIQYTAMALCGMLAGIAGAYMSIDQLDFFSRNVTAGRGYIAMSIDILGRYHPLGILAGGALFGAADATSVALQRFNISGQLLEIIPYLVTLLVIIFAVKHVKAPASLGKNVDDE